MALDKNVTGKTKELFIDAVVSRWEKWKRNRQDKEETWDECWNAYLSEFADNAEIQEFRSQRWVPVSFEAVENVKAQMSKGLFPADNFFAARGDNEIAAGNEALRTLYMQNRLEAAGFVENYSASHLLQQAVIGNSPYMLGWDSTRSRNRNSYKTRNEDGSEIERSGFQYQDSQGMTQTVSISPYTYDGPSFTVLDAYNYVHSPFADDTSRGHIKIYRSVISKAELLALAEEETEEGYRVYDLKAVRKAISDKEDAPEEKSDSDERDRKSLFGIEGTNERDEDSIELLYSHGDFPIKNVLWPDYIVVVANRKHMIRCERSPWTSGLDPLRLSTLIPIKGMPYGLGILESALGQQDIINIRTNQVIDALALALNPILKVKADGVVTEDLISAPGAQWEVEEMDALEPLFLPTQAYTGYNEANIHKEEFTDATFSRNNYGALSREATATEVATTASLNQSVIGRFLNRNENRDIEQILIWFDETEKQFYDPENRPFTRYEVSGNVQFGEITPEVIYQSYTWKAVGSGFTSLREVRIQQLFQWAIAMAKTPAAGDVNFMEVGRAALRDMGRRDADKLLPGLRKMIQHAQQTGEITAQVATTLQAAQGGGSPSPGGPQNPPGMAPFGRGAIPNAGAAQVPAAQGGRIPE